MTVLNNLGLSALFGLLGILVMAIGYVIFDKMIPLDFNKELEKGNMAVGILIAGLLIGIALIVSRVVAA
ncbi:DUF350 domain-containing protein [Clostridium sp. YIM B02515]|jgi:uncharacterized membrane protein YjfL (UPF0719 family)|uniref:DUF350 domain-containing protein n=1 Tax=Clostridium rhizosphaerae TaxID=2803861 RepID=A0ABS1TBI0_9CLOT|nr:DUF350 domain-containing protein [Clostridium rhizosphaerae]MBL4936721.1 DUF350 domain-containing protein [Clostridium rhizosphaerae]